MRGGARRNMASQLTEELKEWFAKEPEAISPASIQRVLETMDLLVAERDEARRDRARSEAREREVLRLGAAFTETREREALRRGFDAAQAWNFEEDRPRFPTWEHFEQHLAELEEDAAREVRIADAEENEP
jgi:hypothetical protein